MDGVQDFASGVAASVIAGLLVAYVVYRFVEAKLQLRQRNETATAILKQINEELDWNDDHLNAFRTDFTSEAMPYPGVSVDGWNYLAQAGVMTALRSDTVAALLPVYARLRTIDHLYGVLWDMRQGGTRSLTHVVAASKGTDEAMAAYADYRNHCELLGEQLMNRMKELAPTLKGARSKVKAEIAGREQPARSVMSRLRHNPR